MDRTRYTVPSLGDVLYSVPSFTYVRDGVAIENMPLIDSIWPSTGYRAWTIDRIETRLICRTETGVWHLQSERSEVSDWDGRGERPPVISHTACGRTQESSYANQSLGYRWPLSGKPCKSCPWESTFWEEAD